MYDWFLGGKDDCSFWLKQYLKVQNSKNLSYLLRTTVVMGIFMALFAVFLIIILVADRQDSIIE